MSLFYQPEISDHFLLTAGEAHHAIKVLRHQVGDEIQLTDGKGLLARARIQHLTKTECACELVDKRMVPPRNYSIHLAIAPTKSSDRLEWMVEKCVETGIDQISFLICRHSERKKMNLERFQKVAISAMKQSQQAWLPTLEGNLPFDAFVNDCSAEQKFIAHVDTTNPVHLFNTAKPNKRTLILVGPEGDFSEEELKLATASSFIEVSLGPNRLRTETAGFFACCALHLLNQ